MNNPRIRLLLSLPRHLILAGVLFFLASPPAVALTITTAANDASQNINWQSGPDFPSQASADPSGSLSIPIPRFPPNVRRTGPGTPHSLSTILNDLQLPLMARSEDKLQWIPMLASRWAVDGNKLWFELNSKARWSDQVPVTTDDIRFTLEFLSATETGAEWEHQRLENLISDLVIDGEHRFAFVVNQMNDEAITELAALRPFAAHVLKRRTSWPQNFDWYPEPTTGPYHLTTINAGESLVLSHTNNWWAADEPFFRGRFNLNKIILVAPDAEPAAAHFDRGELDIIPVCPACTRQYDELLVRSHSRRFRLLETGPGDPSVNGLLINGRHGLLSNRRVREGLITALDMGSAIMALRGAVPATGLLDAETERTAGHQTIISSDLPDSLTLSYTNSADLPLLQHLAANALGHGVRINLLQMTPAELASKLELGLYDLVWLSFATSLSAADLISLFTPDSGELFIANPGVAPALISHGNASAGKALEQELLQHALLLPGYRQQTAFVAAWEWLETPPPGEHELLKPLDPFNPVYGGYFWINRKDHADILAQPERDKNTFNGAPPANN